LPPSARFGRLSHRVAVSWLLVFRQGNDTGEPIQAIGLIARQASFVAPPLQAARGKTQGFGQLLQGEIGGAHRLLHNDLRKAFPNCRSKIILGSQGSAEGRTSSQFFHDSMDLFDHSVSYHSANWRTLRLLAERASSAAA
jgi:hypothetical protein